MIYKLEKVQEDEAYEDEEEEEEEEGDDSDEDEEGKYFWITMYINCIIEEGERPQRNYRKKVKK